MRVVQVEECWHRSLVPLMEEVREQLGAGPVYLTFDIDGIDPAFAPGTGTPEIGGDLVEVAPPYDHSANTSLLAANLLYEMLCVPPGVRYRG